MASLFTKPTQQVHEANDDLPPSKLSAAFQAEKTFDRIQVLLQLWKEKRFSKRDDCLVDIASEICMLLLKTNSSDALAVFLERLPERCEFNEDENILRARVHHALHKGDTQAVYSLIKTGSFVDGEDLIKVWDAALYLDEEKRLGKPLNPLTRFRLRKRNPPPASICPTGARRTNSLPRDATCILKSWLNCHVNDPYPTAVEKQELARLSGLSAAQVKTWFANARRRSKQIELVSSSASTTHHAASASNYSAEELPANAPSNTFPLVNGSTHDTIASGYEILTSPYVGGFHYNADSSMFHPLENFQASQLARQLHAHLASVYHGHLRYQSMAFPYGSSSHVGFSPSPSSPVPCGESLDCLAANGHTRSSIRWPWMAHCSSECGHFNAAKVLVDLSTGKGYYHPALGSSKPVHVSS